MIELEQNQGVGGAILTGHQRALELDADVSVVMAGDAQMDPDHLPALLDPIADGFAQFTKANRFYAYGSFDGMPRHRVFGNVVMSFMTKAASGYWGLFDPQNGYTAIHRTALERLTIDRIAKRYDFENDLLIHLNILGVRPGTCPSRRCTATRCRACALGKVAPALLVRLWQRLLAPDLAQVRAAVVLAGGPDAVLRPCPAPAGPGGGDLHHRQHPWAHP